MTTPLPYSLAECRRYMALAIAEARKAEARGDVPVGAVVVAAGEVIGRGYNRREVDQDPTAHAEIIALRDAARRRGRWYLDDCVLFVTLEPCPMCAGAVVNARLAGLVYGALDPKAGACSSLYEIPGDARLNHRVAMLSGVLEAQCGDLLSGFFRRLRARRKST